MKFSEKGLRYDLTVPFARYVVMHRNDIAFPFKRYQIQPVWRADKPQKGRYREFYQCDVDIVGSDALIYEAELVQIYDEVFAQLNIDVIVKINNRKILAGIAEVAGLADKMIEMTIAIDKLDKIGIDGVKKEMRGREMPEIAIEKVEAILQTTTLEGIKTALAESEVGMKGVQELEEIFDYLALSTQTNKIKFDVTLARGLSYYTGFIVEVAADTTSYPKLKMGSIGGGGRYDNLTGIFGLKGVSGVGVSFGAARIYDVMNELDLFPNNNNQNLKVLFIAFDEASHRYAYQALQQVRNAGINSEIYPKPTKMKKQMKYANARKVPYIVVIGSNEVESGLLSFKNMESGEQEKISIAQIIERLK